MFLMIFKLFTNLFRNTCSIYSIYLLSVFSISSVFHSFIHIILVNMLTKDKLVSSYFLFISKVRILVSKRRKTFHRVRFISKGLELSSWMLVVGNHLLDVNGYQAKHIVCFTQRILHQS